jgi:hypothetical protein
MVRDAGVHHPSESPQACRTGLAPLDNLIPDQRPAQDAGQGGVAVKGGRLPPADWFSMCSSSPPEAFAERGYPLPRHAVECGISSLCNTAKIRQAGPNSWRKYAKSL